MSRPTVKASFEVTEKTFYQIFWKMANINRPREMQIADRGIELLALICCKPMDYHIFAGKNLNGKSKKIELADEMGVKAPWLYEMLKGIVDKGFMTIDEDNFYSFPPAVNALRRDLKDYLKLNPEPELDYIIRFKFIEDDADQGQDSDADSGTSTEESTERVSVPSVESG
jgi:hypothetical protein